jgi:cell division protein FtsW (lipid II flippase)
MMVQHAKEPAETGGNAKVDEWQATVRVRRRRRLRYRKIFAIIFVLLIAVAVMLFLGTDVTSNGKQEWIGGRDDTRSLLLPLGLFVVGMIGLAVCLP